MNAGDVYSARQLKTIFRVACFDFWEKGSSVSWFYKKLKCHV